MILKRILRFWGFPKRGSLRLKDASKLITIPISPAEHVLYF